jgi:polar amino acid transport system substrate-binding protein
VAGKTWVVAATALVLLGAAGTWWLQRPVEPHSLPLGAQLQAIKARDLLRVGVRSYPRPTESRAALLAEPDDQDAALAEALGRYLGVPVQLRGVPAQHPEALLDDGSVDMLIAGSVDLPGLAGDSRALSAPPADERRGAVLMLRNGALPGNGTLNGLSACVPIGSPWAADLTAQGAKVLVYPSSIRAAVAFMAGECRLLADERSSLQRLQAQPDWRFYKLLDVSLKPVDDARVYLAHPDPQALAFVQAALIDWQAQGGQAAAWALRGNALLIDSLKIGAGLVCH